LVFFLIFLLGTAWAGWNLKEGLVLVELEERSPGPRANQAQADKQRLDAMIAQVETTQLIRASSPETVRVVEENMAKYPFREPRLDLADLPPGAVDPLRLELPPVIIDYPPEGIALKGIMIMGKQHVAVMDIPGVGSGMIVKAGDTFMQKKGRVVRIALDKVVVRWGGKNWDIAPSF
jgi:Tfp pilus assembly protein PilP